MCNPEGRPRPLPTFRLPGFDSAFPLGTVREIVSMTTIFLPSGPPSGLANSPDLRGPAIPIPHFSRLFDLAERQTPDRTPMIALREIRGPADILAESARARVPVPSQLLTIPVDRTFLGCAAPAFQLEGYLIRLVSSAALLVANEDRLMVDYGAMAETRRLHLEERI
jgi:hypothetical protein